MTEPTDDIQVMDIESVDGPFHATMMPPGSKSITNRALLLAGLAAGRSRLEHPLVAADTIALREALTTLGAEVAGEDDAWVVDGVGGRFPRGGTVDLGDGGTPARFMLAASCLAEDPVTVDGSQRMRERPVAEGIALLRTLGASMRGTGDPEHLPVHIDGWPDRSGGTLEVGRTASSQFLSALLLIAPWTRDGIELRFTEEPTSRSYIDLTVALLARLGVDVAYEAGARAIVPGTPLDGFTLPIEPDASSAIYWWAAAAMCPGAEITISIPAESAQPDLHALPCMEALGAEVVHSPDSITVRGPEGLHGTSLDAENCPDAAVMLAVLASRARGVTRITGLRTLRVKETDRINALAVELGKSGCTVRTTEDAIEIDPASTHADPMQVATWNDHRMAMAFGILGLVRGGVRIEDPGCVSKSYPRFWDDRTRLTRS